MQAPLGRGAAARLARAVSQAGGLGTLGASWTEPAILREQIRSIARATDGLFCVNLVLDFEQDERLGVAVEERQEAFEAFGATLLPNMAELGADPGQPMVARVHNVIDG